MTNDLRATAEELANRPYRIGVWPDETTDGQPVYLARVIELDDCVGHGATELDALSDVKQAMVDYIESLLEDGMSVPTPIEELPVSVSVGSPLPALSGRIQGARQLGLQETEKPHYSLSVNA